MKSTQGLGDSNIERLNVLDKLLKDDATLKASVYEEDEKIKAEKYAKIEKDIKQSNINVKINITSFSCRCLFRCN